MPGVQVPEYFREDLFQYVGEDRRPPYKWILIGPKRSGSSIHIDPLETSAWNAVISGRKRWVLFPPGTPKSLVKPAAWMAKKDREAIDWFLEHYRSIKASLPPHQQPLELITGMRQIALSQVFIIQQPPELIAGTPTSRGPDK